MNAQQARQVLLLRACELEAQASPMGARPEAAALWTAADSSWADAEALRRVGEQSTAEQFLVQRAALAGKRLAQRDASLAALSKPLKPGFGWSLILLVLLALLVGLATDAVGPARQINILAPPLLAVMLWNIAVYLGLAINAVRGRLSSPRTAVPPQQLPAADGWLRRSLSVFASRLLAKQIPEDASAAVRRFAKDWTQASRPLQLARLAAMLHLAALAVAIGALLALYARGLVFEFRAGWDSTFLSADAVHGWLSGVLGPALAITGQELPGPVQLENLRFSVGGGENAARWIHFYAITTGLVMFPRLVFALMAMWRSRRLNSNFPLPLGERYFQRLLQGFSSLRGEAAQLVAVLPYSYQAAGEHQSALAAAIDENFGPGLQIKVLSNLPMGDEDALPADWPQADIGDVPLHLLLPIFALSATPERETHGAFLRAVMTRAELMSGHPQCRVMIDESGFRQRLSGTELARRIGERRTAWQKLLDEESAGAALFVDLTAQNPANP